MCSYHISYIHMSYICTYQVIDHRSYFQLLVHILWQSKSTVHKIFSETILIVDSRQAVGTINYYIVLSKVIAINYVVATGISRKQPSTQLEYIYIGWVRLTKTCQISDEGTLFSKKKNVLSKQNCKTVANPNWCPAKNVFVL